MAPAVGATTSPSSSSSACSPMAGGDGAAVSNAAVQRVSWELPAECLASTWEGSSDSSSMGSALEAALVAVGSGDGDGDSEAGADADADARQQPPPQLLQLEEMPWYVAAADTHSVPDQQQHQQMRSPEQPMGVSFTGWARPSLLQHPHPPPSPASGRQWLGGSSDSDGVAVGRMSAGARSQAQQPGAAPLLHVPSPAWPGALAPGASPRAAQHLKQHGISISSCGSQGPSCMAVTTQPLHGAANDGQAAAAAAAWPGGSTAHGAAAPAAAPVPAAMKPVARDISHSLLLCSERPQLGIASPQQQQQHHQQQVASCPIGYHCTQGQRVGGSSLVQQPHVASTGVTGSPDQRLRGDAGVPDAPASSSPAPLPRRASGGAASSGSGASGMSPAPPAVPPSPQQQALAGFRQRRSAGSIPSPCNSPASHLMLSGWQPTLRQPQQLHAAAAAAVAAAAAAAAGAACEPVANAGPCNSSGVPGFEVLAEVIGKVAEAAACTDVSVLGPRRQARPLPLPDGACTLGDWPPATDAAALPQQALLHGRQAQQQQLQQPQPQSQQQQQQQPQQPQRRRKLHRCRSLESMLQSQPVPPQETAPVCRSPCVGRVHYTSSRPGAGAAALSGSAAFMTGGSQLQHIMSPVYEACVGGGSSSITSDLQQLMRLPASSHSSTPVGTPTCSSARLPSYASSGTLHSTGSRGSGAAPADAGALLPLPAFEQLMRHGSLHQAQQQQQQQQGLPGGGSLSRAVSAPAQEHALYVGRHAGASSRPSAGMWQQQQQRVPPGAGCMSPCASGMPAAVQPCPPPSSQPPAPSPVLRSRLLHLPQQQQQQAQLQPSPPLPAQQQQQQQQLGQASAAPTLGPGAPPVAVRALSPALHSGRFGLQSAPCSIGAAAAVDAAGSPPSCVLLSAPPRLRAVIAGAGPQPPQPAPVAASGAGLQRPCSVELPVLPEPVAAAGGSCSTPVLEWAPEVPDAQPTSSSADKGRSSSVTAGAAAACEPASCGSAAGGDGAGAGCPGWQRPCVAAYAQHRGRLGYLLSSGLVGVVFEDCSCMLARPADGCALYWPGHDSSISSSINGNGNGAASDCAAPAAHRDQGQHAASPQAEVQAAPDAAGQASDAAAPARAAATGAAPHVAAQGAAASGAVVFQLPGGSCSPPGAAFAERTRERANDLIGPCVPVHLASKARCLQRFAGCLLHGRPYNAHCQPDVRRLPFAAAAAPRAPALQPCVPHVRRYLQVEGCLLLELTDGSQQLVFTGDSAVLLLHAQSQRLAYVTCSARGAGGGKALAHVVLMPLGPGAAAPDDAKLAARLAFAAKLAHALQLPAA